jgi:hypothetical protein
VAFLRLAGAFAGGLLMANSAPNLATAVTGHTDLTPLAGKESSPAVNLIWAWATPWAASRSPARATAAGTGP